MTTELTGRELDAKKINAWIAEHVMGWKQVEQTVQTCSGQSKCWLVPSDEQAYNCNCVCHHTPDYMGNIAAAMQMQERIKELGLHQQYAAVLMKITHNPIMSYVDPFNAIHASAAERVRAAVKVLEAR
jgi:hypothetical protein